MNKYELICLALEEVRKQAYNSQQLKDSLEWVAVDRPDRRAPALELELIKGLEGVLNETLMNLRDKVLEGIAEYNNGIDNVSGVDVALAEVPFELIYERKKVEDFE